MTKEMVDNLPEREHVEAVEILPSNIGNLSAKEAVPLLERASSRIEIVKPKSEFWEGMRENLEGAASYIKAEKNKIASKTFRAVAGASLVGSMVSACAKSPETPGFLPTQEAVATEVMAEPTASPEMINSLNESAQSLIDESFAGLGIHEVSLIGAGTLTDSSGTEYALFTSVLPDEKNNQELDFLLLGELGEDNQVENIKGLVTNEESVQTPVLEFIAVSFNPETRNFSIEGPYIRTNTQTGQIEIFRNATWEELKGPDQTIDEVQEIFGGGVLAARTLPTPTAEPTPTQEASPTPEVEEREVGVFPLSSQMANFITSEMLVPLEQENITRYRFADGSEVPFGVLEQYRYELNDGTVLQDFSGIVRGYFNNPDNMFIDGRGGFLVIETPLESGNSQYFIVFVDDYPLSFYDNIRLVENGEIPLENEQGVSGFGQLERIGLNGDEYNAMMRDPSLIGRQIVFRLKIFDGKVNSSPNESNRQILERQNAIMEDVLRAMEEGAPFSIVDAHPGSGYFYFQAVVVPENIAPGR